MLALGLDLGGSHVNAALLTEDGIVAKRAVSLNASRFHDVLGPVDLLFDELFAASGRSPAQCKGIVFGFPGAVDARAGRVLSTNKKFDDARDFDFGRWANDRLGCRIVLDNDVRLALIGEHHCGAAKGASDALMIAIGTGIGTAVFLEGKPLRGRTNQAGSLGGHIPLSLNGRTCTCGGTGCAEAEASSWALPGMCRDWPGFARSRLAAAQVLDFRELCRAMDAGDAVANAVFSHCLEVWSVLTIAMIHAYSPQVIVMGGGVLERAEAILPVIRNRVAHEAWNPAGPVRISPSALGADAALHATIPLLKEWTS